MAFFFKYVCGVEEPVFAVKLRKTGTRVPVVLSKLETHRLFDEIGRREEQAKPAREREREVSHGRYELAARLQYGAGLRLSELVRLRVKDPASLHYAGTSPASLHKPGQVRLRCTMPGQVRLEVVF